MSSRYVRIQEDEFEEKLSEIGNFTEVDHPETYEKVYESQLPADNLSIRVFSSIQDGSARNKGADAIRCVIWNDNIEEPVGGRRKTLRIGPTDSNPDGWFGNLKPKIEDLFINWRNEIYGNCPECGGQLVFRSGKYGNFLGCQNYPKCENTEDL